MAIPEQVTNEWQLYEKGKEYNQKLNIYQETDRNERMYAGDQWHGVNAGGLPTPVINIFKRVVNYFIASILSQKVKMNFSITNIPFISDPTEQQALQLLAKVISGHSEVKWEHLKMDAKMRDVLLDGALSGDLVAYTYWDERIETGQTSGAEPITDESGNVIGEKPVKIMGDFVTEIIDGQNVMFGNPNQRDPQKQPYILIIGRDMVSTLREEARFYKVPEEEIKKIVADTDYLEQAGDRGKIELEGKDEDGKALYIIKLWKDPKTGTIWLNKSTRTVKIRQNVDQGLKKYPVAWENWDKRKNSYHGQAIGTGLVPNQLLINKLFALVTYCLMHTAFPKVVYDQNIIPKWNNAVNAAVPVNGGEDVRKAAYIIQGAQPSEMIVKIIDMAISLTKEMIGASDAALGDIDPKNTSAIIAVQKAAAVPLENVQQNIYNFVEQIGYIWVDFMLAKYKITRQLQYMEDGQTQTMPFNGPEYLKKGLEFAVKIDVGASSYWSEIASMQTLDNLLNTGKISTVQYLERVKDDYITDREKLIQEIQQEQQAQQQMMLAQQMSGNPQGGNLNG